MYAGTDGYSDFFTEEKLNTAIQKSLIIIKKHPEKDIQSSIQKSLHETFCPCFLSYCASCKHGNSGNMEPIENALIQEINTRLLYTVCGNSCSHAQNTRILSKKCLPIVFQQVARQNCC